MTTGIDTEAFKKAGLSFEEIQKVIESEEEFQKTWIAFDFEDVKVFARKELFSKVKNNA